MILGSLSYWDRISRINIFFAVYYYCWCCAGVFHSFGLSNSLPVCSCWIETNSIGVRQTRHVYHLKLWRNTHTYTYICVYILDKSLLRNSHFKTANNFWEAQDKTLDAHITAQLSETKQKRKANTRYSIYMKLKRKTVAKCLCSEKEIEKSKSFQLKQKPHHIDRPTAQLIRSVSGYKKRSKKRNDLLCKWWKL